MKILGLEFGQNQNYDFNAFEILMPGVGTTKKVNELDQFSAMHNNAVMDNWEEHQATIHKFTQQEVEDNKSVVSQGTVDISQAQAGVTEKKETSNVEPVEKGTVTETASASQTKTEQPAAVAPETKQEKKEEVKQEVKNDEKRTQTRRKPRLVTERR